MEYIYFNRNDFASDVSILQLTLDFFDRFKKAGKNNFLDKPCADFYVCLAYTQLELSEPDKARKALGMAKELAEDIGPLLSARFFQENDVFLAPILY